jgi:hypothetical protein
VETVEGKRHRARERRKNLVVMKRRIRRILMQRGNSLQRQVTYADRRIVDTITNSEHELHCPE